MAEATTRIELDLEAMTAERDELRSEVTEMHDRLAALEAAAQNTEVAAAIEEATAKLREEMDTVRADLDVKAAEAKAKADELTELVAFLTEIDEAKAAEVRKTDRLEAVRARKIFDESHIEANADFWGNLDDEAWANQEELFDALEAKLNKGTETETEAGAEGETVIVPDAALGAGAEGAPAGPTNTFDAMRGLRRSGVKIQHTV